MDCDPEAVPATFENRENMAAEPVLPHIEWNNMAAEPIISPQNVPPEPVLPQVDWNSLQITGQYEEDRMEIVSEEQMYVLLGLRDEDERAQKKEEDNEMVRAMRRTVQTDDTAGAAIPVSDSIPDEVVIAYDKDHPSMDLGTMYPSMVDFRLAVRQFAINNEFALGTEKSDKKRFRGVLQV